MMEDWNDGMLECWVERNLLRISGYSIIPTFHYSKGEY